MGSTTLANCIDYIWTIIIIAIAVVVLISAVLSFLAILAWGLSDGFR